MIIFGVDPGMAITGWGVIAETSAGKYLVKDYGAIYTVSDMPIPQRLKNVYASIKKLIKLFKPDVLAIEKIFFIQNTSSRLGVGQARGVVLLCAEELNIPIAEYAPKSVKLAVTGYGSARKEQIGHMVKSILGLTAVPHPDDVSDALAVALCHAQSYRINELVS